MAKIEILDYNNGWSELFNQEAQALKSLFADNLAGVFHVGSTAVEGMPARSIIDILLIVNDISSASDKISVLCSNGYIVDNNLSSPEKTVLHKEVTLAGGTVRTHSLYIISESNEEEVKRALGFVRMLRNDAEMAMQYADIKRRLADKYSDNEAAYAEGKAKWLDGENPFEDEAADDFEDDPEEEEEEEAPAVVVPVVVATDEPETPAEEAQPAAEEPAPEEDAPAEKEPKPETPKPEKKKKKDKKAETEASAEGQRKSHSLSKEMMGEYVSIGACLLGTLGFFLGMFLLSDGILGLLIGLVAGGLGGFGFSMFFGK